MTINLNDIVILKKPHPSKTIEWKVIRVGATYKLQSLDDNRVILEFTKQKLLSVIKEIKGE